MLTNKSQVSLQKFSPCLCGSLIIVNYILISVKHCYGDHHFDDNVPELVAMSDDENDDAWEECDEEADNHQTCCLFCEDVLSSAESVLKHCVAEHKFSISGLIHRHQLDCFGYIKFINFVRVKKPDPCSLQSGGQPWNDDVYMKPVIEDDALLQIDPDDLMQGYEGSGDQASNKGVRDDSDKKIDYDYLLKRSQEMERELMRKQQEIETLLEQQEHMRSVAQNLVMSIPSQATAAEAIATLSEDEDQSYIGSYGHFSIHEEMLKDKVRTESYKEAILKNEALFKDKVVLDVGCGTGILSMFAARAGAKLVIGVEMSDIIYQAMDIVRENRLDDKITLLKGRMEDVNLPVEKVDIIISEWMGYFLLFESMLDTVLWARDKYLNPGGVLLPNRCSLQLTALDDPDLHSQHCQYWDDVYGFKMTCMRKAVLTEASVTVVKPEAVASNYSCLKELDVATCSSKDLDFIVDFALEMNRDTTVTALAGCFDIDFCVCSEQVRFSTAPNVMPTHWKQTVFLFEEPYILKKGDTLNGCLTCKKNPKDPRSLSIRISLGDKTLNYIMQ